jgi:hypothetical protein
MPFAHLATQATDAQAVTRFGPVHFMQMLETPARQANPIDADEVGVFQ